MTTTATTATTASATTNAATTGATVAGQSPTARPENVPPRVVGRPLRGRLVALVAAVTLGAAATIAISAYREDAPAVPASAAHATPVVGDVSHGGPGSRTDAARTAIPPREDDRAVLAHGGAGRIVTETGATAQLS